MSRRSPPIRVGGVPGGTATLAFEMVGLDLAELDHGGGRVPVPAEAGGAMTIPEHMPEAWTEPRPPTGSDHRDAVRVRALDAVGLPLAGGAATRSGCRQVA